MVEVSYCSSPDRCGMVQQLWDVKLNVQLVQQASLRASLRQHLHSLSIHQSSHLAQSMHQQLMQMCISSKALYLQAYHALSQAECTTIFEALSQEAFVLKLATHLIKATLSDALSTSAVDSYMNTGPLPPFLTLTLQVKISSCASHAMQIFFVIRCACTLQLDLTHSKMTIKQKLHRPSLPSYQYSTCKTRALCAMRPGLCKVGCLLVSMRSPSRR